MFDCYKIVFQYVVEGKDVGQLVSWPKSGRCRNISVSGLDLNWLSRGARLRHLGLPLRLTVNVDAVGPNGNFICFSAAAYHHTAVLFVQQKPYMTAYVPR